VLGATKLVIVHGNFTICVTKGPRSTGANSNLTRQGAGREELKSKVDRRNKCLFLIPYMKP